MDKTPYVFKRGQRVREKATGELGTITEDDSMFPDVLWDNPSKVHSTSISIYNGQAFTTEGESELAPDQFEPGDVVINSAHMRHVIKDFVFGNCSQHEIGDSHVHYADPQLGIAGGWDRVHQLTIVEKANKRPVQVTAHTFKPGDKVRLLEMDMCKVPVGSIATLVEDLDYAWAMTMDDKTLHSGKHTQPAKDFELVAEQRPKEAFKTGDKVRIARPSTEAGRKQNPTWTGKMDEFDGQTKIIENITLSGFAEIGIWNFHPDWLTLAVEEASVANLDELAEEKPIIARMGQCVRKIGTDYIGITNDDNAKTDVPYVKWDHRTYADDDPGDIEMIDELEAIDDEPKKPEPIVQQTRRAVLETSIEMMRGIRFDKYPKLPSEFFKSYMAVDFGQTPTKPKPKKGKSIMSTVKEKIRKLKLSADDRALEEQGFMDTEGERTSEYKEAVWEMIYEEYKPKVLAIARELADAEKAEKKNK
jgi:hypothetical protein